MAKGHHDNTFKDFTYFNISKCDITYVSIYCHMQSSLKIISNVIISYGIISNVIISNVIITKVIISNVIISNDIISNVIISNGIISNGIISNVIHIKYKKRLVSSINPSLLLKIISNNTWTLQLNIVNQMKLYTKDNKGASLIMHGS
jgi:hypothetical protein